MKISVLSTAIVIFSLTTFDHAWVGQAGGVSFTARSSAPNSRNTKAARLQSTIRFSGAVSKGQTFEKQIGPDLYFRLVPAELGWTISIGNKIGVEKNFCGVVTPPYRGINTIHIEGWHFRNSDNSGPNDPGPKNVNAPQEIREFYFVLNDGDYRKAFDALQILLWPYSFSRQQIDQAQALHAKLPKGNGRLTIRDLKLHMLDAHKQAGIDAMTFDVEMKFL